MPPDGPRTPMTPAQMLAHLRAADAVAREAAEHGHHPFGAVLVGPDDRVLMRQGNLDTVRHAETELCRRAAAAYSPAFLWGSTLVTTFEPCAMCAGTMYWANVGRLVYGVEETKLLALTGAHAENPTMSLSCRAGARLRPEADRHPRPLPRDRGRADRTAPDVLAGTVGWAKRSAPCFRLPCHVALAGVHVAMNRALNGMPPTDNPKHYRDAIARFQAGRSAAGEGGRRCPLARSRARLSRVVSAPRTRDGSYRPGNLGRRAPWSSWSPNRGRCSR